MSPKQHSCANKFAAATPRGRDTPRRARREAQRGCLSTVDAIPIVLLILLTLAFYRQIALTNLILSGTDATTYFYPYRAYAAQAIRSGRIPLWNPYLFMGVPFLANPQAAVFYPFNLALCWLPAPKLVAWSIVLHVALAAVFAYLYARLALRLLSLPALLGASAFAFGGFLSGQVEHVNQLDVSAWFPLLLLLWELRVQTSLPKLRWPALLGMGIVVGLGLLAGHAQSSYISLFGLGVYAVAGEVTRSKTSASKGKEVAVASKAEPTCGGPTQWASDVGAGHATKSPLLPLWKPGKPGRAHCIRPRYQADRTERRITLSSGVPRLIMHLLEVVKQLGFVVLVGVGLAAVQLLPTLELARLSIRSGGLSYREAVAFSLKPLPRMLRYTFLPPWGGNLGHVFGGDFFTEYLAYLGVVPLLLAATAVIPHITFACRGMRRLLALRVSRGRGTPRVVRSRVLPGSGGYGSPYYRRRPKLVWTASPRPHAVGLTKLSVIAGLGIFLALGVYNPFYFVLFKIVPGFSLFRAPARWLLLYAFGTAMLAGIGLQQMCDRVARAPVERNSVTHATSTGSPTALGPQRAAPRSGLRMWGCDRPRLGSVEQGLPPSEAQPRPRGVPRPRGIRPRKSLSPRSGAATPGSEAALPCKHVCRPHAFPRQRAMGTLLVVIALAELFCAAQALPLNYPTAPEVFSSLRTAPAHILAAQSEEAKQPTQTQTSIGTSAETRCKRNLEASKLARLSTAAPGRFLSISDILFDPGDLGEIQQIFGGPMQPRAEGAAKPHLWGGQLSEKAIYNYVVGIKRQEIIAPNLPLAWQVYAVDGYDGGVLPLARYVSLQRLLLDAGQPELHAIQSDGRLREGLERVPPSRLLSILGVRYVITDKVNDVWIDNVFYDLAFDAVLGEGTKPTAKPNLVREAWGREPHPWGQQRVTRSVTSTDLPAFEATALGVVFYLEGEEAVQDGTAIAEVRLTAENGETKVFILHSPAPPRSGLAWGRGEAVLQETNKTVAQLHWGTPLRITRMEIVALPALCLCKQVCPDEVRSGLGRLNGVQPSPGLADEVGSGAANKVRLHIRGLTLIDSRDGSNVPVSLSSDGRYRQVHSGDVKIYEVLDALPRAYAVHEAQVVVDDEAAIAAMGRGTDFDPAQTVILAAGATKAAPSVPSARKGEEAVGAPESSASCSPAPRASSPTAVGLSGAARDGQVRVAVYKPEEVILHASLQAPGYVVLSDTWYPGWRATVDGEPARIERANLLFRAVHVPEGAHTVRFTYKPASYAVGLAVSVVMLVGVMIGIAAAVATRTTPRSHKRG